MKGAAIIVVYQLHNEDFGNIVNWSVGHLEPIESHTKSVDHSGCLGLDHLPLHLLHPPVPPLGPSNTSPDIYCSYICTTGLNGVVIPS